MISISTAQWYAWISALFWPFLRVLGLVVAEPILGNPNVPLRVKVGLALFIAILLTPLLPAMPRVDPASAAGLLVAGQQLLIGLAMGFTLRIALTAVETAGQLAGLQMGLGFAVFFDPQSSAQTAVVGQFLGLFAILIFLAIDGHLMVLSALAQSFSTLPVGPQPLNVSGFLLLIEWGGEIFRTGVIISLPIIGALLIANVAVGIMTRAAPQLNIFAVGFPVTLAVGFFALWLSIPFVGPSVQKLFEQAILTALQMVKQLVPIAP
jgi:flagellar biosynthetic protein FliR